MADPVRFIEVLLPSATPGFDPWTFGSRALSPNHRATAVARTEPPKLRVIVTPFVSALFYPLFSLSI